jgi:catechol 2,3-dioxygenase-like lactoylglutathione lyase family enzyme
MENRISFITLAVGDVARARAFYVDGLGWAPSFDGDDIVMIPVGGALVLSLWGKDDFAEELGYEPVLGRAPFTLAYNVAAPEGVDEVLAEVRDLGAEVFDAVQRDWGGYSGYFADPDGHRWEVAYNPNTVEDSATA